MYVILVCNFLGTGVDRLIGPFATKDEALEYLAAHHSAVVWLIRQLDKPA